MSTLGSLRYGFLGAVYLAVGRMFVGRIFLFVCGRICLNWFGMCGGLEHGIEVH